MTLRHVPFLRDEKGELEWWDDEGPEYIAFDEVVFKFRTWCHCDKVYLFMYDNLRPHIPW